MRDSIFICYSHADSKHQLRLRKHLAPFVRDNAIQYWSDTRIKASQNWREEIKCALDRSAISILLVSADFLASDFIHYHELPALMEHTKIYPVLIHHCLFKEFKWLESIQFINDIQKPLAELPPAKRETVWAGLVKDVKDAWEKVMEKIHEAELRTENLPDYLFLDNGFPAAIVEAMSPPELADNDFSESFHDKYEHAISYELKANKRSQRQGFTNFSTQEDETLYMYVQDLLENPETVKTYWVYQYEHIDILDFMPVAKALLRHFHGYDALIYQVHELFSGHGWEGDGEIRLLWFPPFLRIESEDTWGSLAFFVKQDNNGTAFIASPAPIPNLRMWGVLEPDEEGYYSTSIIAERRIASGTHKCFQIDGLIEADMPPVEGETHWLLFNAGRYNDLKVGDLVRVKPSRAPMPLRDFFDIKNTRNIYVADLQIRQPGRRESP